MRESRVSCPDLVAEDKTDPVVVLPIRHIERATGS